MINNILITVTSDPAALRLSVDVCGNAGLCETWLTPKALLTWLSLIVRRIWGRCWGIAFLFNPSMHKVAHSSDYLPTTPERGINAA